MIDSKILALEKDMALWLFIFPVLFTVFLLTFFKVVKAVYKLNKTG